MSDSIPLNKSWNTQSESNLSDNQSTTSQPAIGTKKKRKRNKKYKKRNASKSCTSDNASSPNSSPPGSPRLSSTLSALSISLPSLPSLLPTSPRSSAQRDTITIFENGKRFNGKCIFIPDSMEELFLVATEKLKLPSLAAHAFFPDGQRILDMASVRHKAVVFVSVDRVFQTPRTNEKSFGERDWVTLNVGGRVFSTTKTTLTKDPYNMLSRIVSDDWDTLRDPSGSYLIDRPPEYFAPVLHYLRSGSLVLDDGVNAAGVLEEARFYGVRGISELLEPRVAAEERRSVADSFTRKDIISLLLTSSNQQLRSQGIDLAGVDLSRLDLRGINFRMSNFGGANLEGANLDSARLQQADLKGANMTRASLRGANLTSANLEGAILRHANFEDRTLNQKAILEGANLKNADLTDANLAGANLRATNFKGASLAGANLRGADLAGANLEDTDLRGANVANTNMRGVNLNGVDYDIQTLSSR